MKKLTSLYFARIRRCPVEVCGILANSESVEGKGVFVEDPP
jgi:hypothetical protein